MASSAKGAQVGRDQIVEDPSFDILFRLHLCMATLIGKEPVSKSDGKTITPITFLTAAHCAEIFDEGDTIGSPQLGGGIEITAIAIHDQYYQSRKGRGGKRIEPDAAYDIAFVKGQLLGETKKSPLPIWTFEQCQKKSHGYYLIACPAGFNRVLRDPGTRRLMLAGGLAVPGCSGGAWLVVDIAAPSRTHDAHRSYYHPRGICGVTSMTLGRQTSASGAIPAYFVKWAQDQIGNLSLPPGPVHKR